MFLDIFFYYFTEFLNNLKQFKNNLDDWICC